MGREYDSNYYRWHLEICRLWEIAVAHDVIKRYGITSIIDFGCGIGSFLEGALDCGLTHIVGLEINIEIAKEHIPHRIVPYIYNRDITETVDDMGKFDCSWSFEAAEHIKPEGTEQFIKNLAIAERFIVLTAAPPGQSGRYHINCRPKQFWIDSIVAEGFNYLEEETNKTIAIWNEWKTIVPKEIKRNFMLFKKA